MIGKKFVLRSSAIVMKSSGGVMPRTAQFEQSSNDALSSLLKGEVSSMSPCSFDAVQGQQVCD